MATLRDAEKLKHIQRWHLDELSEVIDDFEDSLANKTHHKLSIAKNYENILFNMAGKSIITFREIICLSINGYPDGALSLARNLYEQLINVWFLGIHTDDENFEEYISDYYRDYDIKRLKALKFEAEYCKNDIEESSRIAQKLNEIKNQAYHKGKGDYWWADGTTFAKLAKDLLVKHTPDESKQFYTYLLLIYKRACLSLHSSCMGNAVRLGVDKNFVGIDTTPQTDGHELALCLATSSFFSVVCAVSKRFHIEYETYLNRLKKLVSLYYKAVWGDYDSV